MQGYKIITGYSCGRIVYEIRRSYMGLWSFVEQHNTIEKAQKRLKELEDDNG
jgi:hypothetical protein